MIDKKQIEFTEHYYDNGDSFIEAKLVLKTGMSFSHKPIFEEEVKVKLGMVLFHNVYGDISKLLLDTTSLLKEVGHYIEPYRYEKFQREIEDHCFKLNHKIEEMNLHEVFS